jgi:hypothetical protein
MKAAPPPGELFVKLTRYYGANANAPAHIAQGSPRLNSRSWSTYLARSCGLSDASNMRMTAATWPYRRRACAIFFSYMRMKAAISSRLRCNVVTVRISAEEFVARLLLPSAGEVHHPWALKP